MCLMDALTEKPKIRAEHTPRMRGCALSAMRGCNGNSSLAKTWSAHPDPAQTRRAEKLRRSAAVTVMTTHPACMSALGREL
jgi:hypothetical protein